MVIHSTRYTGTRYILCTTVQVPGSIITKLGTRENLGQTNLWHDPLPAYHRARMLLAIRLVLGACYQVHPCTWSMNAALIYVRSL